MSKKIDNSQNPMNQWNDSHAKKLLCWAFLVPARGNWKRFFSYIEGFTVKWARARMPYWSHGGAMIVANNVLFQICLKSHRFDTTKSLEAWIKGIVRNEAKALLRIERRWNRLIEGILPSSESYSLGNRVWNQSDVIDCRGRTPLENLIAKEEQQERDQLSVQLRTAMDTLPELERIVVESRLRGERNLEIAEQLEKRGFGKFKKTSNYVSVIYFRAKKLLRETVCDGAHAV